MKKTFLFSLLLISLILMGCIQQKPSDDQNLSQSNSNKVTVGQNDNQESGVCTYYEEDSDLYVDAECNQLMISFKYGYVSNQTKEEVEEIINSLGGKITNKYNESEMWFVEIQPKEKLYELKNIINNMDNMNADFNMTVGLD